MLFPDVPAAVTPIRLAKVAITASLLLVGYSLLVWAHPAAGLRAVATPIMLIGFVITFGILGYAIVSNLANRTPGWRDRQLEFIRTLPALLRIDLLPLASLIAIVVVAAIVSISAGLGDTGGFSQDTASSSRSCPWPIVANHGSTVQCVSHARWLAIGYEFERAFTAGLALFLAISCVLLT